MSNQEKMNNIAVSAILTTLSLAGHTLNADAQGEEKKNNDEVFRHFTMAAEQLLYPHSQSFN